MPSTSMALTPGLASFLRSLKTNPIDTSIDNLISCVLTVIIHFAFARYINKCLDSSSEDRFVTPDHALPQPLTFSFVSSRPVGHQMQLSLLSGSRVWEGGWWLRNPRRW
ncbi:unnamed protein product [Aspergillus oryzae]|uniref:Unnamed protein product n=2 Tax=Aspergillus oryzae TaxID=5062 RepID=A0AAN5BQF2_ASPOZ|nr:unnamed protein product [Aspergillus oryzae]GMF84750.1 unnamed protein product [Aspergillus oryzae]GMG03405.1 unnamed protein product [Aspergillus oryzae]GMG27328.1 unnamed protein product [Aspergillus oryzae]GMG43724.1 unnamed protein product [Aspergillus oryzae var. brunneus]